MLLIVAAADSRVAVGWAAGLFAATAFTDFFDGYLARRWDATSTLGAFQLVGPAVYTLGEVLDDLVVQVLDGGLDQFGLRGKVM